MVLILRDDIKTPIIILTAKNTKEDIMNGFSLGADEKVFDLAYTYVKVLLLFAPFL